jgi:Sel1 repeat
VRLYKLAAELDNPGAKFSLGRCYENGIGVPRNIEEAIQWYKKKGEGRGGGGGGASSDVPARNSGVNIAVSLKG